MPRKAAPLLPLRWEAQEVPASRLLPIVALPVFVAVGLMIDAKIKAAQDEVDFKIVKRGQVAWADVTEWTMSHVTMIRRFFLYSTLILTFVNLVLYSDVLYSRGLIATLNTLCTHALALITDNIAALIVFGPMLFKPDYWGGPGGKQDLCDLMLSSVRVWILFFGYYILKYLTRFYANYQRIGFFEAIKMTEVYVEDD